MWNDNPSEVDLLGFHRFVSAIEHLAVMEKLQPLTIGVYGTWGSGKSSVMQMAYQSLKETDGVAAVWISSWALEDFEHAKSALIISILKALQENQPFFEKKKAEIQKLLKRVDWMRAGALIAKSGLAIGAAFTSAQSGGQPQPVALPSLDETAQVFKTKEGGDDDVTSIAGFQEQFAKLLETADIRSLVIFIDDLDRCMPRTIIQNFEAIRLFLAVPKTVFVIGASEEIIRSAIDTQYPPQEHGLSYGQQYLEKIIQVPIHLPPLNPQETLKYLCLLFAHRQIPRESFASVLAKLREHEQKAKYALPVQPADILAQIEQGHQTPQIRNGLDIANRIASSLHDGTRGNPREIKRFLNTLILRETIGSTVGLDFDLAVMAKLMLLEYYQSSFFKTLFEWHLMYGQKIPHLQYLEDQVAVPVATDEEGDEASAESDGAVESEEAKAPPYAPDVVAACDEWLNESALRTWVSLLPSLADADLTSYFYLARESLDTRSVPLRPLSKEAQEALNDYMAGSEFALQRANEVLGKLDKADIDDILTQLLRRYQTQPGDEKWRKALAGVGTTRPDSVPRLIQELKRLPHTPIAADIMAFGRVAQAHPQHGELIFSWFDELTRQNPKLASAVKLVKGGVATRKEA